MGRGAAFFDLDKTLMEGSSAIHFGRAAYRAGLMSKRQLARDAWANIQFRLKGSTDETTQALWNRILDSIAGKRVTDLARLGPQILSGVLPRLYPDMLAVAWGHQDAGRPVYLVPAASQELSELLARVRRRRVALWWGAAGRVSAGAGKGAGRITSTGGRGARSGLT